MSRSDYPADCFAAAAGSTVHLLRCQPPPDNGGSGGALQFDEALVTHGAAYTKVQWNRNNKVVAVGSEDGMIQLCHANGAVMCVLPRDGTVPDGPITSLSWSTGSKRLAAGCGNGSVYIHDMQRKSVTAELRGHIGGVTAVEYQHEDKFLAVASGSGSMVLYADPQTGATPLALPPSAADASSRLCLASASGSDAAVAAGSERGSVAVWDARTRRLVEDYGGQHGGEQVNALSFVPMRPGWLYSAGSDGRVCLQDRNSGPGHASVFSVGAPATSLMVREDHSVLGVGTAAGVVLLYDPRHTAQPLHRWHFPSGQPVTGLHWQHCYSSLSSRHQQGASAARQRSSSQAAPSSRLGPHGAGCAAPPAPAAAAASIGSRIPPVADSTPTGGHHPAARGRPMSVNGAGPQASSPAGHNAGPAAAAAPAASQQPQSLGTHVAGGGSVVAQRTLLPQPAATSTPAAASAARGERPALAVTPLTGIVPPRYAAAAVAAAPLAGEVTPAAQVRPGVPAINAAQQPQRQQQQLSITPLTGSHAGRATGGSGTAGISKAAAAPQSPLELLAAAPMSLEVTPMLAPPAGRHMAGHQVAQPSAAASPAPVAVTAAPTELPAAPAQLNISPLSSSGTLGHGASSGSGAPELCVSPLPGMGAAAAGSLAASPRQLRSPLEERCTNNSGSRLHGSAGSRLGSAAPRMLPGLASPLPPAGQHEEQQQGSELRGSPSFAENLPLPLPSPPPALSVQHGGGRMQQQQERSANSAAATGPQSSGGVAGAHKLKAASAASAEAAAVPASLAQTSSGSLLQWSIGSVPAAAEQHLQQHLQHWPQAGRAAASGAVHAAATAAASGLPAEFSFVAAERSAEQLSAGGAAWSAAVSGICEAGPAAPGTLQDDLLAMHLDMLTRFSYIQEQQASMGQALGQALAQNQALSSELAAVRRQVATLTTRRDDFLWL